MKKTIIFLATIALAFSCAKEAYNGMVEENENAPKVEDYIWSFTATSEMTKTALQKDRSVSFNKYEEIAVFASNGSKYKYKTTDGGANAVFQAVDDAAPAGSSPYYAVCPYSAAASATLDATNGKIEGVVIGSDPEGTAPGKYNSSKAVCVAKSNSTEFTFKQLTALLKITIPDDITINRILVYNRNNSEGNKAGALTGTLTIAPKLSGDAPTVTVTAPSFQTGMFGKDGSSTALTPGEYYIPILPAQLTDMKGLEIEYQDAAKKTIGRAFNGNEKTFERAKVYNLGTASLSDKYVYTDFEDQNLTGFVGYTEGQLSVVENNLLKGGDTSGYILKDYKSGASQTSGYFDIQTGSDYGYRKFPSTVRGYFDRVQIKIYLGSNQYYPRLKRGDNKAALPALLNGVAITDDDNASWEEAVKTEDWNIFEWNASQLDGSWTDFSNLQTIQLRPMVDFSGNNVTGYHETTNNRTVYIDDITFLYK